jgi:hypothetical protein
MGRLRMMTAMKRSWKSLKEHRRTYTVRGQGTTIMSLMGIFRQRETPRLSWVGMIGKHFKVINDGQRNLCLKELILLKIIMTSMMETKHRKRT